MVNLIIQILIVQVSFVKTEFFTKPPPPPLTPWEHIVFQLCDVYSNIIRQHEYYKLKETVPPDISLIDHETKIRQENMAPPNSEKKKKQEKTNENCCKNLRKISHKNHCIPSTPCIT